MDLISPISKKSVTVQHYLCDWIAVNRSVWKKKEYPVPGYSNENPKYFRNTSIWLSKLLKEFENEDQELLRAALVETWKDTKPLTCIGKKSLSDHKKAIKYRLNRLKAKIAKVDAIEKPITNTTQVSKEEISMYIKKQNEEDDILGVFKDG